MTTLRMTVGQAIVRFMAAQYVERDGVENRFIAGVWGIFGHGNVAGLGQALEELGDECAMPYYRPQNEQAQVHLASAYAKHKNRLQTFACMSSIGPGATNMITGAAQATVNRLPVLLFPSDYFANRLPDPVLQQVEHPIEHDVSASDAFRPVSRYFDRISRPEQLLVLAAGGLPRPDRPRRDRRGHDHPARGRPVGGLRLARAVLREARLARPAPVAGARAAGRGRGARPRRDEAAHRRRRRRDLLGAEAALDAFATTFGIPVCESQAGKGVLPWNHPMNVGPVGANGGLAANRLAKEADLVIHVGSRMGDFVTASKSIFQNPDATFVGINVNGFDAHKLRAVPLIADAKEALIALTAALADHPGTDQAYRDRIGDLKEEWDARVVYHRTPNGETADLAQPEVIGIVNDVGRAATPPSSARRARCPATCSSCGGPRTPRPTTSNTATRAWATRSRPASASRWPSPSARSWSPSATART